MAKSSTQLIYDYVQKHSTTSGVMLETILDGFDFAQKQLAPGSIEEIIAAYVDENGIDRNSLSPGSPDRETVFNKLNFVFDKYMAEFAFNKAGVHIGIDSDTIVPEIFKNPNFKIPFTTEKEIEKNAEILLEYYKKNVQMMEPGQPVLDAQGKETGDFTCRVTHYGTTKNTPFTKDGKETKKYGELGITAGQDRIKNRAEYNMAWQMLYESGFNKLDAKEREQVNKRFIAICKTLGVDLGNDKTFNGAGSIRQLQEELYKKVSKYSEDKGYVKISEHSLEYLKATLSPNYHNYMELGNSNKAYEGLPSEFEEDWKKMSQHLKDLSSVQVVSSIFRLMSTETAVTEIPGDSKGDNPDMYIRNSLLSMAPNIREQKIDEAIHKLSLGKDGNTFNFNFNAKLSSDKFQLVPGIDHKGVFTVGDAVHQTLVSMIKVKTETYIKERENKSKDLSEILDRGKTKEMTGVDVSTQKLNDSKQKYPKITKTPYRALAKSPLIKLVGQLAGMMAKYFQGMVFGASVGYNAVSQSEFEKSRNFNQNTEKRLADINEFIETSKEGITKALARAYKSMLYDKKMSKIIEEARKKGKSLNKTELENLESESKSLSEQEFSAYTSEIAKMLDPTQTYKIETETLNMLKGSLKLSGGDFSKEFDRGPDYLEKFIKKAGLGEEYKQYLQKKSEEQQNKAKQEKQESETKAKTRAEYVEDIKNSCKDIRSPEEYQKLCKVFQIHDTLRKIILMGIDLEREKEEVKSPIIDKSHTPFTRSRLTETGEKIQYDINQLNLRHGAMKNAGSKMWDSGTAAAKKGELPRNAMQTEFTNAVIGPNLTGDPRRDPPRGRYHGSGVNTTDPKECMTTIIADLKNNPGIGNMLVAGLIKDVYGISNETEIDKLGKKVNVAQLTAELEKCKDVNKFTEVLEQQLGIAAAKAKEAGR